MEKKTAVQILIDSLNSLTKDDKDVSIKWIIEQVKEVEKDQIIEAYNEAVYENYLDGEEYYNERFGI